MYEEQNSTVREKRYRISRIDAQIIHYDNQGDFPFVAKMRAERRALSDELDAMLNARYDRSLAARRARSLRIKPLPQETVVVRPTREAYCYKCKCSVSQCGHKE